MQRIVIESGFAAIWREMMDGITLYIRERRAPWQLYCVPSEEFVRSLTPRSGGALACIPPYRRDLIDAVRKTRIPTVNMLRNLSPLLPSVASDHRAVGAAAADHFLSRGFQHFAFLGTNRDWSEGRLAGFQDRLRRADLVPLQLKVSLTNDEFRQLGNKRVVKVLEKWLQSLPHPVAIFCASDYIARLVLEACRRRRIAVPQQAAVLGVDNDLAICEVGPIPLSSIPQNFMRIGFEAARMLDGIMTKRRNPRAPLWIPPRDIIIRTSTDFIAAANPHVAATLRHIHASQGKSISMKDLLQKVGVSRQWLDQQFKMAIGWTPSEEIRRIKLLHVRDLLLNSNLSVQAIAFRCGFTHGENLSRFFKQQTGLPPAKFRRKYR